MTPAAVLEIGLQLVALLIAALLHEVAHGYVAFRLGDPTAKARGRLSLNPIRHIDPVGTVVLPAVLAFVGAPVFGFAKPVPVQPGYFRNPYQGMMRVAVAGPLTNFLLAAGAYACLWLVNLVAPETVLGTLRALETGAGAVNYLAFFLFVFFIINMILGIFNLIPLPPLDGSRVLAYLLPEPGRRLLRRVEPFGFLIVLGLLALGLLQEILYPLLGVAQWFLVLLVS